MPFCKVAPKFRDIIINVILLLSVFSNKDLASTGLNRRLISLYYYYLYLRSLFKIRIGLF
jgi:hypothetical protein